MGFTGKTAVTKCTTLLNKFKEMDIVACKKEVFKGKQIEKWYVNPLLCKTYYRINVDLYEMFQDSLDIFMANQRVLLSALKEALIEKHTPQVKSIDSRIAKAEILDMQKEEVKAEYELIKDEELAIFNSKKNAEAGISDMENQETIQMVKTWAKHVGGIYVGPDFGMKSYLLEEESDAYLDYLSSKQTDSDKEDFLSRAGHLITFKDFKLKKRKKIKELKSATLSNPQ